jgi:hypothetical protein
LSQRPLPTQQTQETNIHSLSGIRICDPSHRTAADLCFRPHGQLGQLIIIIIIIIIRIIIIIIIIINEGERKSAPIIIGATETISISLRQYPRKIPGKHKIKELQKNNHTGHCTHTR